MATPAIKAIRVRMYQVGFGDCFLVSFEYDGALRGGDTARHVLFDFGSFRLAYARELKPIAEKIREHTGGRPVDVVVVSHRHMDHLSGFAEPEAAKLIGPPKLVVRSWTENPDLPKDARGAAVRGRPGAKSLAFVNTLQTAQAFAEALSVAIEGAPFTEIGAELAAAADDQLKNAEAVAQLETWSGGGKGEYLQYGKASRIGRFVPGVRVRVLGPPTIEQHERVKSQATSNPDEFWQLYRELVGQAKPLELLQGLVSSKSLAASLDRSDSRIGLDDMDEDGGGGPPGGRARRQRPGAGPIGPVRWLTEKMARQQLNSLLRIVRIMDDALNNTSVILLLEVDGPMGTTRMLFPGDAQIENWEYALKFARNAEDNRADLGKLDLYKVGHHGSRNATPRSLYKLWMDPANVEHPMTVMMSTKNGVHGKSTATAVPRRTLVEALERRAGTVYSTTTFRTGVAWWEAVADLSAGTGFATPTKQIPPKP
jgi:hypothetical protein